MLVGVYIPYLAKYGIANGSKWKLEKLSCYYIIDHKRHDRTTKMWRIYNKSHVLFL